MKIDIKEILKTHFEKTNEYVTQKQLAIEMTDAGIFASIHSAQNMIKYQIQGKAKSLDVEMINFLRERFNLTYNEIIS